MDRKAKSKLKKTTWVFWLLLIYIITALAWWFIILEKQNIILYQEKLGQLKHFSTKEANALQIKYTEEYNRTKIKYLGEGLVFLILILYGAFFIFRSLKKQLLWQLQQQNFMMAITHELKTPIAIAKLNLETLLIRELPNEKKNDLLKKSLDEIHRLNSITSNILVSSQLESGGYLINKEELNFSELLHKTVIEFQNRFPERIVHTEIAENVNTDGDVLLLQIIVNNLIENAAKYSEKDMPISVKLKSKNTKGVLQVEDKGIGIADEEKKKIFQRFYRIGNEATRKRKGTGLGLYLCHRIAIDHQATIKVEDNEPNGSIFVFEFNIF